MHPLLEIKNLSVSFESDRGKQAALKNISINLHQGEIVAIVGESGSGKSVTAMSVLKLLPVPAASYDAGEIFFYPDDQQKTDLLLLSDKALTGIRGNRIAMVFQEPMTSLNPVHTCGRQVMESILTHKNLSKSAAKEKTINLFTQVRLPDPVTVFDKYPHELSGGQKQRVMIAMAMSCEPKILIADEPTTALDVTVQKSILTLIRELQQQNNMGVIFITHDLGLVQEIADSIVVMYRGEVVEQGKATQVLQSPAHPYTKALIACRPVGRSKHERLPVVGDFMNEDLSKVQSTPKQRSVREKISNGETVLKVEGLSVGYRRSGFGKRSIQLAVEDTSFEIFKGETVGLVGESGSGKSTLGRALLGLIKPVSGRILFEGRDSSKMNRKEWQELRQEIQIVFQDPFGSLNPRMTIGEAISEPLLIHEPEISSAGRRSKVADLLKKVNLSPDHYSRYPHQFSGGQRQRIGIARALILNPEFIVFDESVSALDVSVQAQVLNLLSDLKNEFNFTAIFISHDLSVVHYISDRIMVMNKGRIIETGSADEVFFHPKEAYTKKLVSAVPGNPFIKF